MAARRYIDEQAPIPPATILERVASIVIQVRQLRERGTQLQGSIGHRDDDRAA
jgi:hypothetical protein